MKNDVPAKRENPVLLWESNFIKAVMHEGLQSYTHSIHKNIFLEKNVDKNDHRVHRFTFR